jgi:hypothetical protein
MSEEARGILNAPLFGKGSTGRNLAESIRRRFAAIGGLDTSCPSIAMPRAYILK